MSTALDDISGSTAAASAALRYTRTAIVLHWVIALLVLVTIPLGLVGASADGDLGQSATDLHKPIGITVLVLTLVRLGWRLANPAPELPPAMRPALRTAARLAHWLFYLLLLGLPVSGWWMTSAFRQHPVDFGVFTIPFLPVKTGMASAGPAHSIHESLAWMMIALVGLHVAAALKHHFVDRDEILRRMTRLRSAGQAPLT